MSQRRSNLNEQEAVAIVGLNRQKEKSVRLSKQETRVVQELNRSRLRAFAVMTRSRGVMLGFSSRLNFFNDLIGKISQTFQRTKNNLIDSIRGLKKESKEIIPKNVTNSMKILRNQLIARTSGLGVQRAFGLGAAEVGRKFIDDKGAAPDLLGSLKRSGKFPRSPTPFVDPISRETPKTKAFSLDMIRGMAETRRFLAQTFAPDLKESVSRLKTGGVGVPTPFASTTAQGPPKETAWFFEEFNKSGKAAKKMGKNVLLPLLSIVKQGAMSVVNMGAMMLFTQLLNGILQVFQPVLQIISMFIQQISMGFMPIVVALVEELTKPEFMDAITDIAESIRVAAVQMVESGFIEAIVGLGLELLKAVPELMKLVGAILELFLKLTPLIPLFTRVITFFVDLLGFITNLLGLDSAGKGVMAGTESGGGAAPNMWDLIVGLFTGRFFGAASGAVVEPPGGLFNVGEGGQTEIITPVPLMRQVIREEMDGGGGGQAITINLTINGVAPGANLNELSRLIARKIGWALQ